jgi:hypothetical protein
MNAATCCINCSVCAHIPTCLLSEILFNESGEMTFFCTILKFSVNGAKTVYLLLFVVCNYRISGPIRCTMIFSLEILEKNNDSCILILVNYWKKTGLLHTKISNHNIMYSS